VTPPKVLIIAGSDSGGGAGIQADIKTVTMLGGHAMTAITAITAQNTLGVNEVFALPLELVEAQFAAVTSDLGIDAVKIGMLGTPGLVLAVRDCLHAVDDEVPIVLDPVMISTSGDALNESGTAERLFDLAGVATLITPNVPELEALSRTAVSNEGSMAAAAQALARKFRCPVLAKGGHLAGDEVIDLLVKGEGVARRWADPRIETRNTHGTGCTLASAVATGLGAGMEVEAAIERARRYVRAAIAAAPGFGAGHGPMGHALGVVPFEHIHSKNK
jgi:hydroxymethylpyrimidine/phosphomethylpyrimidine kinase